MRPGAVRLPGVGEFVPRKRWTLGAWSKHDAGGERDLATTSVDQGG